VNSAQAPDSCSENLVGGEQCVLDIGDLEAGESIENIEFGTTVDENIPAEVTTLEFPVQLDGEDIDNNTEGFELSSNIEIAIDTSELEEEPAEEEGNDSTENSIEAQDIPTGDKPEEEPNTNTMIFLPLISR